MILAAAGMMICYQSLRAVGTKHAPPGLFAAAPLVVAIVLRGIMSAAKFRVGRRLRSSALVADAWNDAVDIIDKVFARKTGLQYHIDLHIEVDPTQTIAASHAIGGRVRATLKRELSWIADVLIHLEPAADSEADPVRS